MTVIIDGEEYVNKEELKEHIMKILQQERKWVETEEEKEAFGVAINIVYNA